MLRWSRRGSPPPARTRQRISSLSGLAEAVEDGLCRDGLAREKLFLGPPYGRVQEVAICIVERIAFLGVEAPKQTVDQLGPLLRGELQRFGDDLFSIWRHELSLRPRVPTDKLVLVG